MLKNASSTFVGATILVLIFSIVGKGLGFVREVLFANYFGLGTEFDIYLVAAVVPITINTIILNIALNYFIPSYHKLNQTSSLKKNLFFSNSFWLFVISGLLVAVILFVSAPYIVNNYVPNASKNELDTVISIFNLLLISIPISSGISVLISYLQAESKFRSPAVSQILVNLIFIILLIALSSEIGILTIPLAYLLGIVGQLLYLIRLGPQIKSPILFKESRKVPSLMNNYAVFASIVLIEAIGQLYLLSDRYFYSSVDKGGIAALNYSLNLFLLPVSILSFSFTTVLFPRFSQNYTSNNSGEFKRNLKQSLEITLLIFIPIAMIFILSGDTLIRLMFERGNFSQEGTILTFSVFKIYAYSLPFYAVYAILNKALYSYGKINQLLVVTLFGLIIKITTNFLLVDTYKQEGLALSTIISYFFFFFSCIVLVRKDIGNGLFLIIVKNVLFLVPIFVLSYFISEFLSLLIISDQFYQQILSLIIFLPICYLNLQISRLKSFEHTKEVFVDFLNKHIKWSHK